MEKLIKQFCELSGELHDKLTASIKEFVQKWGANGTCFQIDGEISSIMDKPYITVEVDRHCGYLASEQVDEIILVDDRIKVETETSTEVTNYIPVDELIELWEFLEYVGDKDNWEDFEIKNGYLQLKED